MLHFHNIWNFLQYYNEFITLTWMKQTLTLPVGIKFFFETNKTLLTDMKSMYGVQNYSKDNECWYS